MKTTKSIVKKHSSKDKREKQVLIGLVDCYLKTGRPVGSNTLKEMEFNDLSSATLRNYFVTLEEEGYLSQQHSSGGRIPTNKAYQLYAAEYINQPREQSHYSKNPFETLRKTESRELTAYLQQAAEELSTQTRTAVFLSAPRFEQDFIVSIKLMIVDSTRCLCLLVTDFGQIITEILHTGQKLSTFTGRRIEAYFNWRLTGQNQPETLTTAELELAQRLYNELMVRYIVTHSNFHNEEIYRTAFSTLFAYPEFHDPSILANSLALFENTQGMALLLKECCKTNDIKFWIGDDLAAYSPNPNSNCTVVAIPYYVNNQPVGAIGLLGPSRFPYRQSFALLHHFSNSISHSLTNNLYKFKIEIHQPEPKSNDKKNHSKISPQSNPLLIEDKRDKISAPHHKQNLGRKNNHDH